MTIIPDDPNNPDHVRDRIKLTNRYIQNERKHAFEYAVMAALMIPLAIGMDSILSLVPLIACALFIYQDAKHIRKMQKHKEDLKNLEEHLLVLLGTL